MVAWAALGAAAAKYAPKIINGVQNIMGLFGNKSNSAKVSFEYSKALQQHQYDLNRLTRQTAFQDTRQSLENAGYNPLLAVGQQAQGGTFGASLNVQDPETENLSNKLAKISAMVNIAQQRSQAQVNSANASLAEQQSNATVQDTINKTNSTSAQIAFMKQQEESQRLDNEIKRQTGLNSALASIKYMKSMTDSNYSNVYLNRVEAGLKNAQIGNIKAMTTQTNAQNSAIKAQADWYDKHPKASNYTNWLNNVVAPTVSAFTGSTQGYSNIRNASGNSKQYVKKGGKK